MISLLSDQWEVNIDNETTESATAYSVKNTKPTLNLHEDGAVWGYLGAYPPQQLKVYPCISSLYVEFMESV